MSRGSMGHWGLALGLGFLWAPILLLAVYAFSADRIPFQWGGFSLRWFEALAANEPWVEDMGAPAVAEIAGRIVADVCAISA